MALTKIKTGGIADNAITNAKMADDAIDSSDYADGSIDNVHLAGSIAVSKTLLSAGAGLTLSTNSLSVDADQSGQITQVGTLTALSGGTGDLIWDSPTFVVDSSANRVGIGTATPYSVLDIKSSTTNDIQTGLTFTASADTKILANLYEGDSENSVFQMHDSNAVKIRLNAGAGEVSYFNAGNVGIGTATPGAELEIADSSGGAKLIINASSGQEPTLDFEENSARIWQLGYSAGSDFLGFYNDVIDAYSMVITDAGDVGIGINSPTSHYEKVLHIHEAAGSAAIHLTTNSTGSTVNDGIDLISNDSDFYIWNRDSGNIRLGTAGTERMTINSSGNATFAGMVEIVGSYNGYLFQVGNDGNHDAYRGLYVACGQDDPTGTNYALRIDDGDGNNQGIITFSGGTVSYGTFTANHDVELPESDNENGYPYGTLVEHTELFYKQKNGSDTERGILYKAQKSSSAYSKSVLGAYSSKHASDVHENLHLVYILGDGHIICNGEKGNISVGDGICSSSTDGEGMKADKMAMIIGIAQEDVSFSGGESKLVAVQYGLQQFTPWENA